MHLLFPEDSYCQNLSVSLALLPPSHPHINGVSFFSPEICHLFSSHCFVSCTDVGLFQNPAGDQLFSQPV